jgi:deoxyribose-phosphate aldolase
MVDLSRMDKLQVAKLIDYSILPPNTQETDIREACAVARQYHFGAFFTSSAFWTPIVVEELAGYPDIEVGSAIDFPYGMAPSAVKAFEAEDALRRGCTGLDMVMNVGALKDRKYDVVLKDFKDFKAAAGNAVTKIILEVAYLTDVEIATACKLVAEAGIHYAKTSTGIVDGPTMDQFLVMRETLKGTPVKLKVSGIKYLRPMTAYTFFMLGAERFGTRDGVAVVESLDQMRELGIVPKLQLVSA